jgi:hypothetical protein
MKLFFIIGSIVLLAWGIISILRILSDGVRQEQKVHLEKLALEQDLNDMYEAATEYKELHGYYPSTMEELVSHIEIKTSLEELELFEINPAARDLEPLIKYTGLNKRFANYKVLENGIVTRSEVTSSVKN